jgi:hypothetical protein
MRFSCHSCLACLCLIASPVFGADYPVNEDTPLAAATEASGKEKEKKKFNFVFAPIPIVNPAIGNGLALAGLMLYKLDPESPVSSTAVAAGYTDSDSWGVGALQKANFGDDRWRILAGAAVALLQYDLYVPSISPDFHFATEQGFHGGFAQVLRRVAPKLYAGFRYQRANVNFPEPDVEQDVIPEDGVDFQIAGLGVVGEWDTRNHSYQPTSGSYLEFESNFSRGEFGAALEYDTYSIAFNHFRGGFRDQDVIAWRVSLCDTTSDTPFFERCQFGSSRDLRGYPAGRYYDDSMYAAQIEYRAPLWKRLGAVAFAGVGAVADSFSQLDSSDSLPAAGLGLRLLASTEQRVNVSLDFAVGRDESTFYVYIGEAF